MCVCPKGKHSINNTCFGKLINNKVHNKLILLKIFFTLDINKCEEYGICDQYCLNLLDGKYVCSCDPNYELVDNHRCKIKGKNFK